MQKFFAIIQIIIVLFAVGFSTVMLFRGDFVASFSVFPFLVIWYLYLMHSKK